jgi:uncharacterized protein YndB with AHSA1/START domain
VNATQHTVTTGDNEFTVTRVFEAPIDLVWETLTTPAHLTHFWGPKGTSTPLEGIVVELRPGGRFETVMVDDASGDRHQMVAVYEEIDPPTRLVFRELNMGLVNTTTLVARADGTTEVTITQAGLPDGMLDDEVLAGFLSSLDRNAEHLATLQA